MEAKRQRCEKTQEIYMQELNQINGTILITKRIKNSERIIRNQKLSGSNQSGKYETNDSFLTKR